MQTKNFLSPGLIFLAVLGLSACSLIPADTQGAAAQAEAQSNNPGYKLPPATISAAFPFMEGVLPPTFPQPSFEAMGEEMGGLFRTLKDPVKGREMVIDNNGFVEQLLPAFTNRPLGNAEMNVYRAPYARPASRKPTLAWPLEIPIGGQPADTAATLQAIDGFMGVTELPILLLYASPGAVVPPAAVPWYENKIKNLEAVYVGAGLHFLQEDQPEAIGRALKDWLRRHRG